MHYLKANANSSTYIQNNITIDSLKQLLGNSLADTARIDILNKLAVNLQDKQPQTALSYADDALKLCYEIKDDKRACRVLNTYGTIYLFVGNYSNALFNFLQALRICEALNMSMAYEVSLLNNISICYVQLRQYDVAKEYLLRILHIAGSSTLSISNRILANVNMNMGIIEAEKNNLDTSLIYYKQALALSAQNENTVLIYLNIGETYLRLNQLALTLHYLKQAFPLIKGNAYHLIVYYRSVGDVYLRLGNLDEAQENLFQAKTIAESSGINLDLADIYKSITILYERKGNFKNAYQYHKKYKTLQDSIFNEYTSKKITELQESYELEKRDNKIQLLNKDKMIRETQANKERVLRYAFMGAVVFLVIFSLILIRNVLHKQKINRILKLQKQQIEQQNIAIAEQKAEIEEKNKKLDNFNKELLKENIYARYEVLKSKVNPHFLFNSLSALGNMILKDPEKSFDFVSRFAQLYRSIISTSDKSIVALEKEIEMVKDYVSLQQIRFEENLNVSFNICCELRNLYVPPFALQIIVENVLKHNVITPEQPLHIHIFIDSTKITVTNSIQRRKNVTESMGFGQKNLIERYRIITKQKPIFRQENNKYISSIPVIEKEEING